MKYVNLFNTESRSEFSPTFSMERQATVVAFDLGDADEIGFEAVLVTSAPIDNPCACGVRDAMMPAISATAPIVCCDGTRITVTAAKPIVVLDAPQGFRIRAVYLAGNPGDAIVTAALETASTVATGCC